MSKKPEIFKPNMSFIDNNKKAYYSYLEEPCEMENNNIEEVQQIQKTPDVLGFLNNISNNGSYVFNKKVIIVTKDKTYETKIAGKLGDRLITLDNDSINIDDIKKIYEKK